MNLPRPVSLLMVFVAMSSLCLGQSAVTWENDLESALAKSKKSGKPLLISMHTSTEVACQRMLQNLYTDPAVIGALSEFILLPTCFDVHDEVTKTINGKKVQVSPLFGTIGCKQLTLNEKEVRDMFFDKADVKVPQHIFVGDDGKPYMTKIYELKKPAFIDLLNNALIVYGSKAADGMDKVTKGFLKGVQKGNTKEKRSSVRGILNFNDQRRLDILYYTIKAIKKESAKGECVRAFGYQRYAWAAPTIIKFLRDPSEFVRNCAVVTLEEMASAEACDPLLRLWKKAKDKELKKDLLRAMGPCSGGEPKVKEILLKNVKHRKETMRIASYLSLGYFLDDKAVQEVLKKRYGKEGKSVAAKTGVIWAHSNMRDAELIPNIDGLVKKEKNKQLQYIANAAKLRIKTGEGVAAEEGRSGHIKLHKAMGVIMSKDKLLRNRHKYWKGEE